MKRIGAFYKEKVLSLPEQSRILREIPSSFLENMEIVKDLFGWKIYYTILGRKSRAFIECRSEDEARYLKILNDSGMTKIYVPKDDEYLRSILPELERLKTRTEEILNEHLYGILSRKMRRQLRFAVYMDLVNLD
ncbi:MAG: hypothetical protein DRP89_04520 [Candidatus Neomarinimicrobiota bacterium]|nr:MAG: hypothetical protein DRP89_04520 [Candidatus Neomarinimicrobiota bacterium]